MKVHSKQSSLQAQIVLDKKKWYQDGVVQVIPIFIKFTYGYYFQLFGVRNITTHNTVDKKQTWEKW